VTPAAEPGRAWERGTARVLHGGRPVGVAFLIPGRLLLTCAHVVASTDDLPEDEPLPELFPVTLDFPLLPGASRGLGDGALQRAGGRRQQR
jgi:hypothetical protein